MFQLILLAAGTVLGPPVLAGLLALTLCRTPLSILLTFVVVSRIGSVIIRSNKSVNVRPLALWWKKHIDSIDLDSVAGNVIRKQMIERCDVNMLVDMSGAFDDVDPTFASMCDDEIEHRRARARLANRSVDR